MEGGREGRSEGANSNIMINAQPDRKERGMPWNIYRLWCEIVALATIQSAS